MKPLNIAVSTAALMAKVAVKVTSMPVTCASCEDTGFVEVEDDRGIKRLRPGCMDCGRYVVERVDGVPAELRGITLDSIGVDRDNRAALTIIREVIEKRSLDARGDLVLVGPTGTGKTWAAVAALNSCCRQQGIKGLMVKSLELLRRLQPGQDQDARERFLDRLVSVPVLLVDDLGAEQGTDYARRTLLEVYETRHDRGLATVTTTNLDLGSLAQHFDDDRLTDRLAGWARVIPMKGESRRLARAKSDSALRAVR